LLVVYDQFLILNETNILIAPRGASSLMGLFLNKKSNLIIIDRQIKNDGYLLTKLSYLKIYHCLNCCNLNFIIVYKKIEPILDNIFNMMNLREFILLETLNETTYIFFNEKKNLKILLIFFDDKYVLNEAFFNEFKKTMDNINVKDMILITNKTKNYRTDFLENIENLNKENYNIELYDKNMLMYNPCNNKIVYKHKILSEKEKFNFLLTFITSTIEKKKITDIKQLNHILKTIPVIKKNDPIAKYLGTKDDDIIKIERESESTGFTSYFRRCIK